MKEFAVVGAGIGGASIAAYLDAKGYDTVLFEKEPYLGGCSSTFSHGGYRYNTGATTLAGYQSGHIVKEMFDAIGFTPKLIPTDPSIVVIQGDKVVPRHKDLDTFVRELNTHYPHPKHQEFWSLVYTIGDSFYRMHGHHYKNSSFLHKIVSLPSYLPLLWKFKKYLLSNAHDFIHDFYGTLTPEYTRFLEAQIMIVAQAYSKEINFFTAALSLGYTFNETHYAIGGLGTVFNDMTSKMKDLRANTTITKIERKENHFLLHTRKETIKAKHLILNSTIYDSSQLFEDKQTKAYYQQYKHLQNHQSSFMLYMTVKSDRSFAHHYQIIQEGLHPFTISNALFVSISDKDDNIIAPKGHYSITASIHTDSRLWDDSQHYKEQKKQLELLLSQLICDTLGIKSEEIVHCFSATPKTFKRYIMRSQLGGNPITMKNFLPRLPGNDTPIKNLFHVGDSVYAAQGWPGVMLGVANLRRLLDV